MLSPTKTVIRTVVPKSAADTYKRFAKASGKSLSAVLAEFLLEAEPQVRRLSGMLEVAKQQRSLFPKATIAELEVAIDQLSGDSTEVLDRVQNALQLPFEAPKHHGKRTRARKRSGRASGRPPGRRTPD